MNLELFTEFMTERPSQHLPEWQTFLELCELHMTKHKIETPVVVELGVWRNKQKKFYEQLLGAHHIGIDISCKRSTPDILGDTHDPKTLRALKGKLNGRAINILFIDAGHSYKSTKKDFEMYSSYCSDIIAFHDIEHYRHREKAAHKVHVFWDELKEKAYNGIGEYKDFLFITINQCHHKGRKNRGLGIGVIIKR